jgi:hypothetical protein
MSVRYDHNINRVPVGVLAYQAQGISRAAIIYYVLYFIMPRAAEKYFPLYPGWTLNRLLRMDRPGPSVTLGYDSPDFPAWSRSAGRISPLNILYRLRI